jgi:hypothetical protein
MPKKQEPSEPAPAGVFPPVPQSIEFVEPKDGLMFVYANHVQIGQSVFDIRFAFGEILGAEKGKARILNKINVTMTWFEAKVFNALLSKVLETYESVNGPLTPPKLRKLETSPSDSPKT